MKRPVPLLAVLASFALGGTSSACSVAFGIDDEDYVRGGAIATDSSTATDAGNTNEGGPVDAATPDGATASPCSSPHLFCDDFDDPSTTLTDRGWMTPFITDGGTMVVDDLDSVSKPRSLSVIATPGGTCTVTHEVFTPTAPTDMALAFDIRVETPGDGVALASINLGPYHVRMIVRSSGVVSVDEWDDAAGRVSAIRPSSTAITGRWVRVELSLHFVANQQPGSRILLRVDGVPVVDEAITPSVGATGNVSFDVGDVDHPQTAVRARFDNVSFDAN